MHFNNNTYGLMVHLTIHIFMIIFMIKYNNQGSSAFFQAGVVGLFCTGLTTARSTSAASNTRGAAAWRSSGHALERGGARQPLGVVRLDQRLDVDRGGTKLRHTSHWWFRLKSAVILFSQQSQLVETLWRFQVSGLEVYVDSMGPGVQWDPVNWE